MTNIEQKWLKEIRDNTKQLERIAKRLDAISRQLDKLDCKTELQTDDIGDCNICKYVGLEHRCNQCVNGSMFYNVKDKPQMDDFFRNPTVEERKAVADYIDSISVPTGVNVFDLIDEPQMERGE